MNSRMLATLLAALASVHGSATPTEAQSCEPDGDIQFVCGPISPEDLALVPDSAWVIVASWEDDGYLSAADSRNGATTRLFPTAASQDRHDTATYGDCPGMTTDGFRAHGISLRPGNDGTHTLYVVRHGARESVEIFEIDARGTTPGLTWTGCAVAPNGLGLNAVVALPDGGFAATSPRTSDIWEWHTGDGWTQVPGSEDIGPNGIEVSPDGQWFLVAGYASQSVIRLSRGQTPVQIDRVGVGFNIDNVHWAPDGTLLAAGHSAPTRGRVGECIARRTCEGIVSHVARVDTETMTARSIFRYPTNSALILGTTAIEVNKELWVGQVAGGTRIARVPLPTQ
ncbi:MAG TPA: hypothetical protein DIU48_12535 [Acidobacteria bacterium]|uniref:SMP-30/Gluconolactonase/LRE-like region domain-containing protein n=1 Tax=marine metagenome TaxID=408172 RepID=A0A381SR84_9ZZZZ|nr:hypothetical protein [Acidobacteriota bacterium]